MKKRIKHFNINYSKIIFVLFILVTLITLQGCSLLTRRVEKSETKELIINTKGKESLSIDNIHGDITVKKSESDTVAFIKIKCTVKVPKNRYDENLSNIKVDLDTSSKDIKINTDITQEGDLKFFFDNFRNKTSIEITVPKNLKLIIDATNGDVSVKNIENDVTIDLTNGDISLDNVTGKYKIETTNGNLTCDIDSTKGIDAAITNGKTKMNISKTFSANLDFEVTNGKIIIDEKIIPTVEMKDKKSFKGKIGNSDSQVKINIINGKINLKQK